MSKTITEQDIERRLRLHIANLCFATVGARENDIRECKGAIVREVVRIVHDATNPHLQADKR